MEIIKKEIELDENRGYEYRVVLPTKFDMRVITEASEIPLGVAQQVVAVYRYSYHHPYHKTHVYEFDGVEIR